MYKEQESAEEIQSSENDLSPQAIDDLVQDMSKNLDSVPENIRQEFLKEYQTQAEIYRSEIIKAFHESKGLPAIFGKATVRGTIFELMSNFRIKIEKKRTYDDYIKFMENQKVKPIDEKEFFQGKSFIDPLKGMSSWSVERHHAYRSKAGRAQNPSAKSVCEHWEFIKHSKFTVGSKVKFHKGLPGRAQRIYTIIRITAHCKLLFKGEQMGMINFPEHYCLAPNHEDSR